MVLSVTHKPDVTTGLQASLLDGGSDDTLV